MFISTERERENILYILGTKKSFVIINSDSSNYQIHSLVLLLTFPYLCLYYWRPICWNQSSNLNLQALLFIGFVFDYFKN